MATEELNEYDAQLARATRLLTNALTATIRDIRPAMVEKYGDDIAGRAIVGALCLGAHLAPRIAAGASHDEIATDEELLLMVRSVNSPETR